MTKCVTSPQLIDILCFSTRFHARSSVFYISKLLRTNNMYALSLWVGEFRIIGHVERITF